MFAHARARRITAVVTRPSAYSRQKSWKATLVSLGKVTDADVAMVDARFDELDVNDDGRLSIEDLIGDMDQLAADLAKVLRAREEETK